MKLQRTQHCGARLARGFTLLEMLMVVAIIAMLAMLVVPSSGSDNRSRLNAAAEVLLSDIELAQVLTVAAPKQPVIVQFEPDKNAYWLARADTPSEPMIREGTNEPYMVQLGKGRVVFAADVNLSIEGVDDDRLTFSPHGGLSDPQATPLIRLRHAVKPTVEVRLSIAPVTGTISIERVPLN